MHQWLRGALTVALDPDRFFQEQQGDRQEFNHAITFLVVAAAILGALRFTFAPVYPDTIPGFGWIMSAILAVPGILYAVAINSLLAQVVLSLSLQRDHAMQFHQISADYRRTVAVFCYATIVPALLLWIPSLTAQLFIAIPILIAVAGYTTYVVLIGLSRYHDLPLYAAMRWGTQRFRPEQVTTSRLLAGTLVILFTLEFAMIALPLVLA